MTRTIIICDNQTTGAKVRERTSVPVWDCEALGLLVSPGDVVQTTATGTAGATMEE